LLTRSYTSLCTLEKQQPSVAPYRLVAATYYMELLIARNRLAEAETVGRQPVTDHQHLDGDNATPTWLAKMKSSTVLVGRGKLAEAEGPLHEMLPYFRRVYGEQHFHTIQIRINLSAVLIGLGRWQEADTVTREALDGCRRTLPRESRAYMRA